MNNLVTLEDCPPGPFVFEVDGVSHLGFKTEYRAMETIGRTDVPGSQIRWTVGRWPDAYCMDSGEVFWGGVSKHEERAALLVRPCEISLLPGKSNTFQVWAE